MRIIITGATGLVGKACTEVSLNRGWRVTAIIRSRSQDKLGSLASRSGLEIIHTSSLDYDHLDLGPHDAMLHTAWDGITAQARLDARRQVGNITATVNAIHLAARSGCAVFVDAGSQAECGNLTERLTGRTPAAPTVPYGIAKVAAAELARFECARLGLRFVHTRILSVFGPGMPANSLIASLIRDLQAGLTPRLTRCEQIWDFIDFRDAADAILAIVERGVDGATYPVGSGNAQPLRRYVEILRDVVSPGAVLDFGAVDYRQNEPMYLAADLSELTADTGFEPAHSFAEGIRHMLDHAVRPRQVDEPHSSWITRG